MKQITLFLMLLFYSIIAIGQQTGNLSGVIKDKGNITIVGAYIRLTPSQLGTVSDEAGRYRLGNIPTGDYTLVVSFIGYKTISSSISISSNEKKVININLEDESVSLTDVIVTAQKRTQNQKDVPIAISNVSGKFLENNVVETMAVMSGYTPGVQVSEQTALFPAYVIRGLTSDYNTPQY